MSIAIIIYNIFINVMSLCNSHACMRICVCVCVCVYVAIYTLACTLIIKWITMINDVK